MHPPSHHGAAVKIDAGRLNERVMLLRPTNGSDASGGPVTTYTDEEKRWCARLRSAGRVVDREPHRQPVAAVTLLLRLDSLTKTITTEWRLRLDGETLIISGLDRNRADGSLVVDAEIAVE